MERKRPLPRRRSAGKKRPSNQPLYGSETEIALFKSENLIPETNKQPETPESWRKEQPDTRGDTKLNDFGGKEGLIIRMRTLEINRQPYGQVGLHCHSAARVLRNPKNDFEKQTEQ